MPDENIDTLKIVVEGDSKGAVSSLKELLGILGQLKSVTGKSGNSFKRITDPIDKISASLNNVDGNSASSLDGIAGSLERISRVKISVALTNRLTQIKEAVDGIDNEKLSSVADSMEKIGNINVSGSRGFKLPSITSDTANVKDFPDVPNITGERENISLPDTRQINRELTVTVQKTEEVADRFAKVRSILSEVGHVGLSALRGIRSVLTSIGSSALNGLKTIGNKIKEIISRPLKNLKSSLAGIGKKVQNFFTIFKKRLTYRAMNAVITAITKSFKEGIDNIYQYSKILDGPLAKSLDVVATSFLYLSNSLGALLAPLINALVPYLERAVRYAVELINQVTHLFAAVTGASTWTRAVWYPVEYAEAADEATKANEKLKKSILGIDELNVLTKNETPEQNKKDYSKMFEEVPVTMDLLGTESDSILEKIARKIKDFFDWLKSSDLLDPIRKAWENMGERVINAAKHALSGLWDAISAIGESLYEVWMNGTGQRTVELLLSILANILDTIGFIGEAFARAWREAGTGTRIVQAIWDILNLILELADNITRSLMNLAATIDFSPMLLAIADMLEKFRDDLVRPIVDDFSKFFDERIIPILKWIIETGIPRIIRTLGPLIDACKNIWDLVMSIADSLTSVKFGSEAERTFYIVIGIFEQIYKLAGSIANKLNEMWNTNEFGTTILTTILSIFNRILAFVWDILVDTRKWVEALQLDDVTRSLVGFIEEVQKTLDKLWSALEWAYREVFLPIVGWIIETVIPKCLDILTSSLGLVNDAIDILSDDTDSFWDSVLKPLIAWIEDTVGKVLEKIKDWIEDLRKKLADKSDKIKGILEDFGEAFAAVWDKVGPIVDWMTPFILDAFEEIYLIIDAMTASSIDVLYGFLEFLAGVFTGDWERAWNGISSTFEGVCDNMLSVWDWFENQMGSNKHRFFSWIDVFGLDLEGKFDSISVSISNFVKRCINNLIDMVNGILGVFNSLSSSVSSLFGIDWFTLPIIDKLTLDGTMASEVTTTYTDERTHPNYKKPSSEETTTQSVSDLLAEIQKEREENGSRSDRMIELLEEMVEKDSVTYVSSEEILSGFDRKNRRDGMTAVPVAP